MIIIIMMVILVHFCPSLPEGTVLRSHIPSFSNLSRISQLNIPGFSRLYSSILFSTSGVVPCYKGQKKVQSLFTRGHHDDAIKSLPLKSKY